MKTQCNIPQTMKAIFQEEAGGPLVVREVPVPLPKAGEVLIKMEATPINPSDLSFLQGTYAVKANFPVTPGIEGSGTVVHVGKGLLAKMRMGKRVTCSSTPENGGTWAEYMTTSAMRCIPIQNNIEFDRAAMLIVNPLTALSFIDITKEEKHKAIVNNAAASALGQMLVRLAKNEGIPLINIVRKAEQEEVLKKIGAKHILNSEDSDFILKLKDLMQELNATLIFDAVGGEQTGILLEAAPNGSKLVSYAKLSEQNACFDSRIIVQQDKSIHGFFLGNHTSKQPILKKLKNTKKVQKLLNESLHTKIQQIFTLEEANQAVETYRKNMTKGKVLFKMN